MFIRFLTISFCLVAFFVGFWTVSAGRNDLDNNSAPAVPTYRLTDLGVALPQANPRNNPASINQLGQVAGTSGARAARFINGTVDDLGTIQGGGASSGSGINSLGHVAGDSEYSVNGGTIRHAAVFKNGTVTDLGFNPSWGPYSRATSINDLGDVVGYFSSSLNDSGQRAFIWDSVAGFRDLGTIGGGTTRAVSINNAKKVTGSASTGLGMHAFIWDPVNGMRDLGTLAGDFSSGASINANGHIAGKSTINGFDSREHAFLYDGTTMRNLGAIGSNDVLSDRSWAYGINIHDHVVGATYLPFQGGALSQVAFVYRDGQMLDLNTLVDSSGSDYRLFTATAINDAGQIAVDAIKISTNERRAVLLTPNAVRKAVSDFDGDGKTDISVARNSSAKEWWYQRSVDGAVRAAQFGATTDRIVPSDFTGDGKTDIAIWRPSTGAWFILRSEDNSFFSFPFGATGDVPVPADYDADGKTDAAVFRPSSATWFILKSGGGGTLIVNFGLSTDKPVAADYDGDGKADIAIWRPAPGEWWIQRSSNGSTIAAQFGVTSDRPVPGDFTGDGKADIAIWRPSNGNWFVLRSEDSSFFSFPFGATGDIPSPGDYDSDGKTDAAIFRPSNATWFAQRSTAGTLIQQFGITTDIPVPSAYVP